MGKRRTHAEQLADLRERTRNLERREHAINALSHLEAAGKAIRAGDYESAIALHAEALAHMKANASNALQDHAARVAAEHELLDNAGKA